MWRVERLEVQSKVVSSYEDFLLNTNCYFYHSNRLRRQTKYCAIHRVIGFKVSVSLLSGLVLGTISGILGL